MGKITNTKEVSIDKLKPYENNAKIHDDFQVEKLCESIKEFGFLNPCIIDEDYNVIAGHGRIEAVKKLGWEKVPCLFVEGLTEQQRKAYILADNKLSELAEWDIDLVSDELNELLKNGFEIDLTGFSEINIIDNEQSYIDDLLNNEFFGGEYESLTTGVTFQLPIEYKQKFENYVKEYTKSPLVELIIKEIEEN